jgi:hypothetical protein
MTARSSIFSVLLALVVTLACSRNKGPASGGLEVVQIPGSDTACTQHRLPRSGALELVGSQAQVRTRVSIEELGSGRTARRQLPADLYTVSWVPAAQAEAAHPDATWLLPKPGVLVVVPGQVTRLSVRTLPAECSWLDEAEAQENAANSPSRGHS